jgi:hypothetical protein
MLDCFSPKSGRAPRGSAICVETDLIALWASTKDWNRGACWFFQWS